MAPTPIGGVGARSVIGAGSLPQAGQDGFGKVLKAQQGAPKPVENAPVPVEQVQSSRAVAVKCRVDAGVPTERAGPGAGTAEKVLDRVAAAQRKMDQILQAAESGKTFSPAELLSLQAHVYRASQELDLAGKVVEKATGGVKQVLQTQV